MKTYAYAIKIEVDAERIEDEVGDRIAEAGLPEWFSGNVKAFATVTIEVPRRLTAAQKKALRAKRVSE